MEWDGMGWILVKCYDWALAVFFVLDYDPVIDLRRIVDLQVLSVF